MGRVRRRTPSPRRSRSAGPAARGLGGSRLKAVGGVLFGVSLGCVVVAAWWSTVEALEERRSVAAARDLQMASMTVETADAVTLLGGDPQISEVASAVEGLSGGHDAALHALTADEAARARDLLVEIAGCGAALLDPDGGEPVAHGHQELHSLLELASRQAAANAARAERQAVTAVLTAVVAVLVGAWMLVRARFRSRRERSRAEAEVLAGRRLASLINDSPEMFVVIDRADRIVFRSASAEALLGSRTCGGDDIVALADDAGQPALRAHLNRSDAGGVSEVFALTDVGGAVGWFDVRVSDLTDDPLVDGHVVTARDITDEVQLRDELQRLASTDVLTGLPNRRILPAALDDAALVTRDEGTMMALLTIDIDGFKAINDTLGHLAGDELLAGVADRLGEAVGPNEVVLRLGGDEFAVVMSQVTSASAAVATAQRLLEVLAAPIQLGDCEESGNASIGVAVTGDPDHVGNLLNEADLAMYAAKRQGGSTVVLFEPELASTASRATQITRALRLADHDTELSVVFQPIVTATGTDVVGLEALLRWTSPELGSVGPDEFIPLAEASGEICRIGRWVLDEVCRQLATWTEMGLDPNITVSVNVSPRQLAEDDFVSEVLATARAWSIPLSRLVVEVTESVALEHSGLAQTRLEQLRSAGIRISIDDFGSGYSNLGQLLRVPFDVIKIDRSLLLTLSAMREHAGGDPTGPCAIMEAIVSIAGILDAPVVCEGVETEQQHASLRASGVHYIQGYLTGRPLPAAILTPQLIATGTLHPTPATPQRSPTITPTPPATAAAPITPRERQPSPAPAPVPAGRSTPWT